MIQAQEHLLARKYNLKKRISSKNPVHADIKMENTLYFKTKFEAYNGTEMITGSIKILRKT